MTYGHSEGIIFHQLVGWLVVCLVVWLFAWLVGLLVGQSVGRSFGWLVGWLVGRSVGRLVGWLAGLLVGRSVVVVYRRGVWGVQTPPPPEIPKFGGVLDREPASRFPFVVHCVLIRL